jgi:hypothetical protein
MVPGMSGGLAAPSSAATGPIGGDTFSQRFGGLNINTTPWWVYVVLVLIVLALAVLLFKSYAS